jgi:tetratricopeptide (TPR) repeat protein
MMMGAELQKDAGAVSRNPTGSIFPSYTAFAAIPARYALERSAWAEAAALTLKPSAPAADAITVFGRAMGLARLKNTATARREIDALEKLRQELLSMKDTYWAEQVDIQRKGALAWITFAEGNPGEAVKLMRAAADAEDASEKHVAMENRLWPMRELLGELLLELKQASAALREFERALQDYPNRLRGVHGAARAAQAAGNRAKASEYYNKLVTLTAKADLDNKVVEEARAFLAAR